MSELVAVPAAVVTVILPLVAVAGTLAVIDVSSTTLKLAAVTPLNFTASAPVNCVPVTVIVSPATPLVGLNELMAGAVITVKLVALVAVPKELVTVIGPVLATTGTRA